MGPVPPVALTVILPLLPPLQPTLVCEVIFAVKAVGWVTVALEVAVQLCASVTVTLYVFAPRPLTFDAVAPLLHK